MKGSLVILSFFVGGVIVGRLHLSPVDVANSSIGFYALLLLLFSVGLGIGREPETLRSFRQLDPRFMLLPVCTIVGTLLGVGAAWLLLPSRGLTDCLAIGSGMGYYSLSSIFITEYRGPELGTISLLANIVREVLTLVGAPLMVYLFGRLAPISAGGATTMDTTLPIITHTCGREWVALSIFHGFVTDFSVPFLVSFFCSM